MAIIARYSALFLLYVAILGLFVEVVFYSSWVGDMAILTSLLTALVVVFYFHFGEAARMSLPIFVALFFLFLVDVFRGLNIYSVLMYFSMLMNFSALIFSTYMGRLYLGTRLSRWSLVAVLVAFSLVSVFFGVSKNINGAAFFYSTAFAFLVLFGRGRFLFDRRVFFCFCVMIFVYFFVAYSTGYRSLFLFSFIFFVLCFLDLKGSRCFAYLVKLIVFLMVAFLYWFYISYESIGFGYVLNDLVESYTGRQALSGRQLIWSEFLSDQGFSLFGLGPEYVANSYADRGLSAHSYYIHFYAQAGMLGIGVLLYIICQFWRKLSKNKNLSPAVFAYGSSLYFVFLVHNSVETLFFQNGTLASIPFWMTLGLCISLMRDRELSSSSRGA